jgi:outer membrane protein assembly factor BamB
LATFRGPALVLALLLAAPAAALPFPSLLCAPIGFGCEQWVQRYDGPGNGLDDAGALAMSPDGGTAYLTGHSLGDGTGFDMATLALDTATGARRWVARVDGPDSGTDEGRAVAPTPDGALVVTAGYVAAGGDQDIAVAAHDAATGDLRWSVTYDLARGFDLGLGLAVAAGRAYVAGLSEAPGGDWDATILALDAATGARAWATQLGGAGQQRAHAVAVTPDGSFVVVAGLSEAAPGMAMLLTAGLDAATGAVRWTALDGGPSQIGDPDSDAQLALLDGATLVASAAGQGADGTLDIHVVARDAATGALAWAARHAQPEGVDRPHALAVAPWVVLVAGATEPKGDGGSADYVTFALNAANGEELWAARFNGLGSRTDRALALAVSPDGARVFVAGESFGTPAEIHVNPIDAGAGTGLDYGTVAYRVADGVRLWAAQYDGANSVDRARGIAVTPDGARVIVGGHSHGGASGFDYAAVAYDSAGPG